MLSVAPQGARGSTLPRGHRFPIPRDKQLDLDGNQNRSTSSESVTKFCLCVEYDGARRYRTKKTTRINSMAERTGSF
jgi:hypothetical protein